MEQKEHTGITLNQIFESIPQAIIATDRKLLVSFINAAAEKMTGWTQSTAVGKNLSEVIKLFDRQKQEAIIIPSLRRFLHGRESSSFWNVLLKPNQEEAIPVDVFFAPLSSIHGIINGCIVVLKDVSERAKNDMEFVNKQKIEAIANMAGGLANDFTNSLGVISGHASSIADNLIPKTRAHEEAMRILEATKRASNATKHLMSIARIGGTRVEMKVESIHLGDIVKDAIATMEESFASKNISFKLRNAESMPYVMADERQMLDCLINLLLNSTDAMPSGGAIVIDADTTNYKKTGYVVLRIRDHGKGMSKEILLHAFDPFFTTKPAGAGLGLTVVRNSIERWGGFIKIRSRPDHGTSIRLFLRKAKIQPTREAIRDAKAGRETILIIDNEKALLDRNELILKSAGYNVYTALNAQQGIEIYQKNVDTIDLTVIDLVMPGMNGKKVLEAILAFNPTASIIMTSGFSRDYVRKSLERGAWSFLQKPFSPDYLLTTVRKTLDQNNIVKTDTLTT